MLELELGTLRLFLHVLAATVWVGGQLTLAALVPALRGHGREVTRTAARAFDRVAWSAFGVLVLTGVWNVLAQEHPGDAWNQTMSLKYALVLLSGVTAFAHRRARSTTGLAVFGGLTGLTALGALFVGVWLAQ